MSMIVDNNSANRPEKQDFFSHLLTDGLISLIC